MPIFRKSPPKSTTYLDCHGYNGWEYCVTGQARRYSVELRKGAQCFVLAEYAELSEAYAMALWLLDNGAVPDYLRHRPAECLRMQPCI